MSKARASDEETSNWQERDSDDGRPVSEYLVLASLENPLSAANYFDRIQHAHSKQSILDKPAT
jgi:hypothetical protein